MPNRNIYLINSVKNQITGSKLPSKKDCLSVLFYNMRFVKLNLNESISLVIDECLIYWKKARLPTHDPSYCSKKLKKLYDFWRTLEKNKSRNSDLHKQRRQDFINELNDLFDIAHVNAMSIIKINDDKKFLTLQRQRGRPGCMLGLDLKLDALEKRKETRVQNENKFREQMVETYEEFETGMYNYLLYK